MATGLNWIGGRMGHSSRWPKLSPIPQCCDCRKHLRVQKQPLLIEGELEVRRGRLRMRVTGAAFAAAFHLLFIYLLFFGWVHPLTAPQRLSTWTSPEPQKGWTHPSRRAGP